MDDIYTQSNNASPRAIPRRSGMTVGTYEGPPAKVPRMEHVDDVPVLKFYRRSYETLPPGPLESDEYGVDVMSAEYINVPPGGRDFIQTDVSFGVPKVSKLVSSNVIVQNLVFFFVCLKMVCVTPWYHASNIITLHHAYFKPNFHGRGEGLFCPQLLLP